MRNHLATLHRSNFVFLSFRITITGASFLGGNLSRYVAKGGCAWQRKRTAVVGIIWFVPEEPRFSNQDALSTATSTCTWHNRASQKDDVIKKSTAVLIKKNTTPMDVFTTRASVARFSVVQQTKTGENLPKYVSQNILNDNKLYQMVIKYIKFGIFGMKIYSLVE
jgi:hypothetical protein